MMNVFFSLTQTTSVEESADNGIMDKVWLSVCCNGKIILCHLKCVCVIRALIILDNW